MKNIAELVKKPVRYKPKGMEHEWPLPDTLMGIELEVEFVDGVIRPQGLLSWREETDGSLQSGREYVLFQPLAGGQLRAAINEIMTAGTYARTLTGSTHIHMDMLEDDTTPEILRTMVMLVYAMEPLLYAAGDASREWCGYANRLRSGPDNLISAVMDDNITQDMFRRTYARGSSQFGRYYGLNMAALLDYGSLEFRYFPTATNENELVGWVELVQSFKKAAISLASRERLTEIMEDESQYNQFLFEFFGKWEHLFSAIGEYHEVRNNYRKALITANISTAKTLPVRFAGSKVFAGGRFSAFIKKLPKMHEVMMPVYWVGPGDPIPSVSDAENDQWMVYSGQIYHTSALMEATPSAHKAWYTLGDYPYTRYAANETVIATLQSIVEESILPINDYVSQAVATIIAHSQESTVEDDIDYREEGL